MYTHTDAAVTRRQPATDDTAARWFCTRTMAEARRDAASSEHAVLSLGVLAREPADPGAAGRLRGSASARSDRMGVRCAVRADRRSCQSGEEVAVAVTVANSRLVPCRATARLVFWQEIAGESLRLKSYLLRLEMRAGAVYSATIRHTVTAEDSATLRATLCVYDEAEHLQTMDEAVFVTAPAGPSADEIRRAA